MHCGAARRETYQFYELSFCSPKEGKEYKLEGLGEVLEVRRLQENSGGRAAAGQMTPGFARPVAISLFLPTFLYHEAEAIVAGDAPGTHS